MKRKARSVSEHDALVDKIRGRFSGPGWVFLKQVANRLGEPSNYADAVALSLYASRGRELHGFEVKVRREDLVHELRKPSKADAVGRACDRWWLVLGSEDLMKGLPVPPVWGILVSSGSGTRVVREAGKLDSEPWDRAFVSSLLIRAGEANALENKVQASYQRGVSDGERRALKNLNDRVGHFEREKALHAAAVAAFESASGIPWSNWPDRGKEIGAAVRVILDHDPRRRIEWLHGLVRDEEKRLRAAIKEAWPDSASLKES